MDSYKPYSFLIKKESNPATLTYCFVVWMPAGKKLGEPETNVSENTTTFTYEILSDPTQPVARQEEFENRISWDGNQHYMKVIIGSGSGGNGGTATIDSINDFE